MHVFVASVHHTGTQFTQKLFEDLGYEVSDKTPAEAGNSVNYFHRCHIADAVRTELKQWMNMDIPKIVPLRHPVEVAKSWKARGKKLSIMLTQFELLQEVVLPRNPLFLPVDHGNRDAYFDMIRLKADIKLNTDWTPHGGKRVGSGHPSQLTVPDFTPADLGLLLSLSAMDWLTQLYPEPWCLTAGEQEH